MLKILLFSFSLLPTAGVLTNRLQPTEGSWRSLSAATSLQSEARSVKGLSVFWVGEKKSPVHGFCPDRGLMGDDGHKKHVPASRWREGGRGVQDWELMYIRGGFMSMYGKTNRVL